MPRPRVPLKKAELTGAAAKDPQRFRDRSEPQSEPLGKAPGHLSQRARNAWAKFRKEWPWLTKSDGALLADPGKMGGVRERSRSTLFSYCL